MIHSIEITGYRALHDFKMDGLGRVNLLVGKNNSGKTSVLEALYLLVTNGDPQAFWRVLSRRGEMIVESPPPGRPIFQEVEMRHLFYGHRIELGSCVTLETRNGEPDRSLRFEITEADRAANPALYAQIQSQNEGGVGPSFAITVSGTPKPLTDLIPLNGRGCLRIDVLNIIANMSIARASTAEIKNHQYLTTDSFSVSELQNAFNALSLSPREEQVLRAMRIMDDKIERIATTGGVVFGGYSWPTRGGLKVKLRGLEEPVPIGSLGEGTWRMLALAISIVSAQNGVLLVDEIDIGLHHTVIASMWRFVADVAREFGVQVFATTHSQDCVRALATICRDNVRDNSEITLQRLDVSSNKTVAYNEAEIIALASNRIEAR